MKRRSFVLLLGSALAGCSGGGSGRSEDAEAALRERARAALAADGAWAASVRGVEVQWWTDGYRVRVEYVLDFESGQPVEIIKERADATAIRVLGRLFGGSEPMNRATVVAFAPDGETSIHLVEVTGVTASTAVWEAMEPGELEDAVDVYRFERGRFESPTS